MLLPMLNVLYFYISTFRSLQCPIWLFCLQFLNFVLSRYVAEVLFEWFWNGSIRPCYYRYDFCFTFHVRCPSVVRSSYCRIFSASGIITFLCLDITTSIDMHVQFLLSRIMMPDLLLGIVSVCTVGSITLPSSLVSTDFGTWSYRCLLSNFTPVSLHMLKCSRAHTVMSVYVVPNIGHVDTMCSVV